MQVEKQAEVVKQDATRSALSLRLVILLQPVTMERCQHCCRSNLRVLVLSVIAYQTENVRVATGLIMFVDFICEILH